jgi:hypothetical protein
MVPSPKQFLHLDGESPNISQAVIDNGDIWIADINSGLVKGENHDGV